MKTFEINLFGLGVHLLFLSLVNQSNGQALIEWEDYLTNVGKKFVSLLQDREITGNGMPLNEFTGVMNSTSIDVSAVGTAKFHSGFVAKIDAASILSTSYRSAVVDAYSNAYGMLVFDGVQTAYDVDYDYEDYKGRGTLLLWFKQIRFELAIRRNHTTNEIIPTVSFDGPGNQSDNVVKVYPNNGHTQVTAKEVMRVSTFRAPISDSFEDWTKSWGNELSMAVAEYKFPEICYYCP